MAVNSAAYIVELLHNLNFLSISRLGIVNAAEIISSILELSVYMYELNNYILILIMMQLI